MRSVLKRGDKGARADVDVVQRLQQAIAIARHMASRRWKQRRNAVRILHERVLSDRDGGKPPGMNREAAYSLLQQTETTKEGESSPRSRSSGNNNPRDHRNATTVKHPPKNYRLWTGALQHNGCRIGKAGKHNRTHSPSNRRNAVQESLQ